MPAARAVRLEIRERLVAANRHQGLHYTDLSDQEGPPMDNVALFDEHTFAKEVAYVVVSTTH